MIDPTWKRICGIQCQDEGTIGAVWMAHEKPRDLIHVYDACIFRNEVWAVIAEGLNCRGRNIPIAWNKKQKDIADKLLERGCNMLYDPLEESAATTEVWSREILERMKTGRFKVDKRIISEKFKGLKHKFRKAGSQKIQRKQTQADERTIIKR